LYRAFIELLLLFYQGKLHHDNYH